MPPLDAADASESAIESVVVYYNFTRFFWLLKLYKLHKTVLIDRAVSVTIEARVDTTVWQLTASDMSQNNASKSVHYITHQGYYNSLGYIKLSGRGRSH